MSSTTVFSFAKAGIALTAIALLAFVLSGCGGSSNSNTASAHVRAYNAIENGGNCTVFVNSGSANGSQPFEQASQYLFLKGGQSTFTFTLSGFTASAYPTTSLNLVNGQFYTAIAFGRADVGATDLRYPALIVLSDNTVAVPSGQAFVRIVNAAPDGGTLSATAGSTTVASSLAYGAATSYATVPAGTMTLATTLSNGGGPSSTVNLASGAAYTFVVDERTIPSGATAATYGVVQLKDN